MVRTTISINGGKQHELDEKGDIPEEGKMELARAIGSTLGKMVSPLGHNSGDMPKTSDELSDKAKRFTRKGGLAVDQLKGIIARIEKLEEEKKVISDDIRDIFTEAKGNGFDVKAIRTIIKMRKIDQAEREEQETVLDTYLHALGMLPDYEQADLFESQGEGAPADARGEAATTETGDLYERAVEAVKAEGKASTSFVQRVLRIGYNQAASLIERMEQEGIVSPANHVGKREVLPPREGAEDATSDDPEGEAA